MTEYVYTLKAHLHYLSRTRPTSTKTVAVVAETAQEAFGEAERVLPQTHPGYRWTYEVLDVTDFRLFPSAITGDPE